MKKATIMLAAIAVCLIMVLAAPLTLAASKKNNLPVKQTWDLDMIGIEEVAETGDGVYIAVLDTGLAPNWRDYFPDTSIMTNLGMGFKENLKWDAVTQTFKESGVVYRTSYIGSTGSTHGTHVTSTIIGYDYYSVADTLSGFSLDPVHVDGVAPNAKIIPVKVLSDYHIGKAHTDDVDYTDKLFVMGTDKAVAAGINYATDLYEAGCQPMIITMSLGGPAPAQVIEDAIDRAIEAGVIVVASAGNEGEFGMGWPGAYPQVISVGAVGWKYEWYWPDYNSPFDNGRYRLWWLQDNTYGYNDLPETEAALADEVYVTSWSSRELEGQELDVLAPGSWVRGPYPGGPGYSHLPWWSEGNPQGIIFGGSYFYLGGTSMAAPHVTGVIALMLQKNPDLEQAQVESILKSTALDIMPGSMTVWDYGDSGYMEWCTYSWEEDAVGSGLIQADEAIGAVPP